MSTTAKLKAKRIQVAISAVDDYHKTIRSFSAPMARMLKRLSLARKRANSALARVNTSHGSEMEIDESELREVVPVSEYRANSESAKMNALRLILSLRDMK